MTLLYLEFLEKCMPVRRGSGSAMIPEVSILDRSCPTIPPLVLITILHFCEEEGI